MLDTYRDTSSTKEKGRSCGASVSHSLLYRRTRFDVWESGTFWLSETPKEPGSTSWGNKLPRICTWARLLDRETGRRFYVFNTHWDLVSQPAREKSGQLMAKRVADRAAAEEPVVVLGDFNAGEDNPARAPLLAVGLRDSFRDLHADATDVGTGNQFRGRKKGPKIDAVLVSRHWQVVEAEIDHTEFNGRTPSDHYPVTAVLQVR